MELDKIITGDSAVVLQSFPPDCIDLTVTSPPYDNLRDYQLEKFVVWRYNISHEEKQRIIAELKSIGVKPVSPSR